MPSSCTLFSRSVALSQSVCQRVCGLRSCTQQVCDSRMSVYRHPQGTCAVFQLLHACNAMHAVNAQQSHRVAVNQLPVLGQAGQQLWCLLTVGCPCSLKDLQHLYFCPEESAF